MLLISCSGHAAGSQAKSKPQAALSLGWQWHRSGALPPEATLLFKPQLLCLPHRTATRLVQLASRALSIQAIWARAGDQKGILDLPAAVSASVDTGEPEFYLSELKSHLEQQCAAQSNG